MKSKVDYFLYLYFYELEIELNRLSDELKEIKFESEEANTDEFLKKYIKEKIESFNNIGCTSFNSLQIKNGNEALNLDVRDFFDYKIGKALIPDELTIDQKQSIMETKSSVYTNPDLYLEIEDANGKKSYVSVELKSTKNNIIPGSSVQQVSPYEWVIFVKRSSTDIKVATGFYINSITEKLPFPDRSPRPLIGFKTLVDWNKKFRKIENTTLTISFDCEVDNKKIELLNDWQNFLAEEWMVIIKSEKTKNSEKWFNNAIRKFAVKFLNYTNELTVQEKDELLLKLNSLIK